MEQYIGEIRPFPYNFAPESWASCNGQLLLIAENQALFSLIGTTFGGDGQTTFGLPDLRGRVPVGSTNTSQLGGTGGVENVTVMTSQMPSHSHALNVDGAGTSGSPVGSHPAAPPSAAVYGSATDLLAADSVSPIGGGQPHSNLQPYLAVNYCISLYGIYPSQN